MGRVADSGKKRKTGENAVVSKYFFIYEGARTEPDYFNQIKINANDEKIGLKALVELISLKKFGPFYNMTDINSLIELIDLYRNDLIRKKYSLDYFISVVMDPVSVVYRKMFGKEVDSNEIEDFLLSKHAVIAGILKKDIRYRNNVVNSNDFDDLLKKSINLTIENFPEVFQAENVCMNAKQFTDLFAESNKKKERCKYYWNKGLLNYIKPWNMPRYSDGDIFVVVHDRDYHKYFFSDEKYKSALKEASEKKIKLAISTPMFEYWLLLHHEDKFDLVFDKSSESKQKVQNILDCLEGRCDRGDYNEEWERIKQLSDMEKDALKKRQKAIDKERFKRYIIGFKGAIQRSLEGIHDNESLMDCGGTSVGVIFKEMID